MMRPGVTNKLVKKILFKNSNICCLCLSNFNSEPVKTEDEVELTENNMVNNVQVGEIMSFIFGEEVFDDISVLNDFCLDCVTLASNTYQFIKHSKENIQHLLNSVDHLNNCFETVPDDLSDCKTLFITLNSNFGTTNQYFDNVVFAQNIPSALERFKSIVNYVAPKQEIKKEVIKRDESPKKEVTKIDIKNIMVMMDKKLSGQLQCKFCMKVYNNEATLKEHYLRFHAPKLYTCELCPKMFAFRKHLAQHKEQYHANLVCMECGKKFRNKYSLRTHEESHQTRFVCPDCGRVYKNRNTLKSHKDNDICQRPYRHSPADAKFTCDYCQKRYTQKISLRVHIQYEHLGYKYLKCKWCDKKFNCQSRLNAHAVKHTKEKNFACSFCNGKFVSKESLLYHTRIHTGERPYQCPHCDSRFLSASRRQAHVKSYHTDPTVECDICGNKFRSLQYLQKHKKIHYPEHSEDNNSELQEAVVKIEDGNKLSLVDASDKKNNIKSKTTNDMVPGDTFSVNNQHCNVVKEEHIKYNIREVEIGSDNKIGAVMRYKVEKDGHIQEHLVFY